MLTPLRARYRHRVYRRFPENGWAVLARLHCMAADPVDHPPFGGLLAADVLDGQG